MSRKPRVLSACLSIFLILAVVAAAQQEQLPIENVEYDLPLGLLFLEFPSLNGTVTNVSTSNLNFSMIQLEAMFASSASNLAPGELIEHRLCSVQLYWTQFYWERANTFQTVYDGKLQIELAALDRKKVFQCFDPNGVQNPPQTPEPVPMEQAFSVLLAGQTSSNSTNSLPGKKIPLHFIDTTPYGRVLCKPDFDQVTALREGKVAGMSLDLATKTAEALLFTWMSCLKSGYYTPVYDAMYHLETLNCKPDEWKFDFMKMCIRNSFIMEVSNLLNSFMPGRVCSGRIITTSISLKTMYFCEIIEGDLEVSNSKLTSEELTEAFYLLRELHGSLKIVNNSEIEDLMFIRRIASIGNSTKRGIVLIEGNKALSSLSTVVTIMETQSTGFLVDVVVRNNPNLCIPSLGFTWANQQASYIEFNMTACNQTPTSSSCRYFALPNGLCSTRSPDRLKTCSVLGIVEEATLEFLSRKQCQVVVGNLVLQNLPQRIDEDMLAEYLLPIEVILGDLDVMGNLYLTSLSFLRNVKSLNAIRIDGNPAMIDVRLPSLPKNLDSEITWDVHSMVRLSPSKGPFSPMMNQTCNDCPYLEAVYRATYTVPSSVPLTASLTSNLLDVEATMQSQVFSNATYQVELLASSKSDSSLEIKFKVSHILPGSGFITQLLLHRSAILGDEAFWTDQTPAGPLLAVRDIVSSSQIVLRPTYAVSAFGYAWKKTLRGEKRGNKFVFSWDIDERDHVAYVKYRKVYKLLTLAPGVMESMLKASFPTVPVEESWVMVESLLNGMEPWRYAGGTNDLYRDNTLEIAINDQNFEIDFGYEFKLFNLNGQSVTEESDRILLDPAEPILKVQAPSLHQSSSHSITLSWDGTLSNADSVQYEVVFHPGPSGFTVFNSLLDFGPVRGSVSIPSTYRSLTVSCWNTSSIVTDLATLEQLNTYWNQTDRPATIECVKPFTNYGLKIRAVDTKDLTIGAGSTLTLLTEEGAPAKAPVVKLVRVSASSVQLVLFVEAISTGILRGFNISTLRANETVPETSLFLIDWYDFSNATFNYTLEGLDPFTPYTVTVRSFTRAALLSRKSDEVVFKTTEWSPGVCEDVLIVSFKSSQGVWLYNISWGPPVSPNGVVTSYQVVTANQADVRSTVYEGGSLFVVAMASSLSNYIMVRAVNSFGPGAYSAKVAVPITIKEDTSTTAQSASSVDVLITVIVPVVIGALFLVLVVVLVVKFVQGKYSKGDEYYAGFSVPSDVAAYLEKLNGTGPKKEIQQIEEERLEVGDKLGEGKFGIVYRGMLSPNADDEADEHGKTATKAKKKRAGKADAPIAVAVKTVKFGSPLMEQNELQIEATIMNHLSHPNIVQLIGVAKIKGRYMIVTELCANGALLSFLHSNVNAISLPSQLRMATDVADAMFYLSSIGIVHRDIAARNVLVTLTLQCKLSDFGFSRCLDDRTYYTSTKSEIPVRWTAPEALDGRKYSPATDVWSFGILLYEILTFGKKPYSEWSNQKVWVEVKAGYRIPRPDSCPQQVYDIMAKCWNERPELRPTFHWIRGKVKEYADLFGGVDMYFDSQSSDHSVLLSSSPSVTLNSSRSRVNSHPHPVSTLTIPLDASFTSQTLDPRMGRNASISTFNSKERPDFANIDQLQANRELDLGLTEYACLFGKNNELIDYKDSFDPRSFSNSARDSEDSARQSNDLIEVEVIAQKNGSSLSLAVPKENNKQSFSKEEGQHIESNPERPFKKQSLVQSVTKKLSIIRANSPVSQEEPLVRTHSSSNPSCDIALDIDRCHELADSCLDHLDAIQFPLGPRSREVSRESDLYFNLSSASPMKLVQPIRSEILSPNSSHFVLNVTPPALLVRHSAHFTDV